MQSSIIIAITLAATTQMGGGELDLIEMLQSASSVGLATLSLLCLFSILSWGIMLLKFFSLRRAYFQTRKFLQIFWTSEKMETIYNEAERLDGSPVAHVFKAGYIEFRKSRKQKNENQEDRTAQTFAQMGDLESIERSMRKAINTQLTLMESLVGFLATTASSAPFIGLFGTVWGIMLSFHKIGAMGNASLATVAPGISEALIATAFGLAAAIPSVIGYNYFLQKIKIIDSEMENFSSDFLNILKRHFL